VAHLRLEVVLDLSEPPALRASSGVRWRAWPALDVSTGPTTPSGVCRNDMVLSVTVLLTVSR